MKVAANARMRSYSRGESTSTRLTPRESSSRSTRSDSGRSSCTTEPGPAAWELLRTCSHSFPRYSMSARRWSALTPCAAVRMM